VALVAALALLLAMLAFAAGTGPRMGWSLLGFAMLVNAATMLLPTFLVYFLLLLGLQGIVTRRSVGAAALLVGAALPFVHWGHSWWQASRGDARHAAEIARVPTAPPLLTPFGWFRAS
jgi:hypothetical protein